ncbi:unnamed protein product [Brugia timori]|uniref:Ovule protein n=1 Tax=Brugia timori TaxID=42155 RepID=A0A0R3Q453_9BILA|nr:unnamed protein product [Brugia timori]
MTNQSHRHWSSTELNFLTNHSRNLCNSLVFSISCKYTQRILKFHFFFTYTLEFIYLEKRNTFLFSHFKLPIRCPASIPADSKVPYNSIIAHSAMPSLKIKFLFLFNSSFICLFCYI